MIQGEFASSLQPQEELALKKQVFEDPLQSGVKMFTLLAWATGGTAEEIHQIRWANFVSLEDGNWTFGFDYVQLHLDGDILLDYRMVPIGRLLGQFLRQRFERIKAEINAKRETPLDDCDCGSSIYNAFVCCSGDNYLERCAIEDARYETRKMLLQAGVSPKAFRYLELYKNYEMQSYERIKETMAEIFLLRRTYGTLLPCYNISSEEMSYLLGLGYKEKTAAMLISQFHKNQAAIHIWSLARRCALRPIFNPLPEWYIKNEGTDDFGSERYALKYLYDLYRE